MTVANRQNIAAILLVWTEMLDPIPTSSATKTAIPVGQHWLNIDVQVNNSPNTLTVILFHYSLMSITNDTTPRIIITSPSITASRTSENGLPQTAALRSGDFEKQVQEFDLSLASHDATHDTPHALFAPMHYEPGYAYPLIVWLHGQSYTAERQLTKIMPVISMRNFVAVAPRGLTFDTENELSVSTGETKKSITAAESATATRLTTSRHITLTTPQRQQSRLNAKPTPTQYYWPDTNEGINEAQKRVFDCLQVAKQKCNIAKRRIFLAGFGDGGTMAFRIAMQFPQYFAGIISLGGAFPQGKLPLCQLQNIRSLPCLMQVGRDSTVFSPTDAGRQMQLFHTAGMSVTIRQYPCRQEMSIQMLEDVNRWIMEKITG